jgi:phosphoglycolate phosphatase
MTAPTVVFDLDGTLVDTAPDLIATLNTILAREGLPPVDLTAARNMVGGGARVMLERGLAAEGRALPAVEVDRLVKDFIAHYADHITDGSRPFQGVEAALDAFAGCGFRLAVCTNKFEWLSLRLLERLSLSRHFAAICGPDTFGVSKPDPRILLGTIERAGGQAQHSVMVGDSITDIATARAAGIPVVAVDFGYSEAPIARLDPDRVASRFADLPQLVFELVAAGKGGFDGNG